MQIPQDNNFKEREERLKRFWEDNQIYAFDDHSDKPIYSVDTPPPYVNADHLHTGHIMSYAQAEFVVRYKRMNGYNVFYPMGFDDNGYPTEKFVEKKYNIDKNKISKKEFVDLCLKETQLGSKNYKDLWMNLGISVDWSKTYSTISPLAQRVSQWSFIDLYKKGKAYRKTEPMLWCTTCGTAMAQADLEDKEIESFLNYINFEIEGEKYTIATTRPELLPACLALFANPNDERFIHLKEKEAIIPLFGYSVPILFDESVSMEYGTGLMMVCSWGDTEDIRKIKEFSLEPRQAIDAKGRMTALAGKYEGMKIVEARTAIFANLKEQDYLTEQKPISHITNVHERCETPIEFIPTTQWFIDTLSIKDKLIELGRELNWYPENMRGMYEDWVNGLKWDWCISRQRYYGVTIPAWYCKNCGEIILPDEKDLPIDPTASLPPIDVCPKCGNKEFIPDTDVMDTWATSSCTPFMIPELIGNNELKKLIFPASLRPQAFEIIRTWIFYSIVKSYYHFGTIPFKDVMISGHGLDEKGRKISKRLGNYIDPNILLKDYGADAIRYWATGATLGSNHRFHLDDVKKGKHTVNKLWNAAKFCSTYIADFTSKDESDYTLEPEDQWILHELNNAIKECTESFEKYEYADVRTTLDKFFWGKFCDYYLEIIKHRANEESAKYTMYICMLNILKLYAPLMPFVTEEIYQTLFKDYVNAKSIHLTIWPKSKNSPEIDPIFESFLSEIDNIRKEKADKGLRYNDELDTYTLQSNIDKSLFGEKLRKIFKINELKSKGVEGSS